MKAIATPRAVVRTVWLLTFVVVIGIGVGLVWWPSSQRIDAYRSAAELYYDEANRNEDEVRDAAQLRELQKRIVDDLRSIAPAHSSGAATSQLLGLLSQESKTYGITVKTVVPGVKRPAQGPFETVPLEITLSGRFANVLHFVSDLTRHDLLIETADLDISNPQGNNAELAVVVHATLYRFKGTLPSKEVDHAAGSV